MDKKLKKQRTQHEIINTLIVAKIILVFLWLKLGLVIPDKWFPCIQ